MFYFTVFFTVLIVLFCQAWLYVSHLPVVEVSLSVKGWWEGCEEQTERMLPSNVTNIRDESSWQPLHADQEYVLQVSLRRLNAGQQRVSLTTHTQQVFFSVSPSPSTHDDSTGFRGSRTAGHRRRAFPNLKTKAGFWFSGRLRKKNCWLSNAWDSYATAAVCPWPSTRRRRREGKSRTLILSLLFLSSIYSLNVTIFLQVYLHTVPDERQLPRPGSAVRPPSEHHPGQHSCAGQQ